MAAPATKAKMARRSTSADGGSRALRRHYARKGRVRHIADDSRHEDRLDHRARRPLRDVRRHRVRPHRIDRPRRLRPGARADPLRSEGTGVYIFAKEKKGRSECYGACAKAWPPLITKGLPRAGKGARLKLLGTTRRKDGRLQVTYRGQPLYYYEHDTATHTICHDVYEFGGDWLAIRPNGRPLPRVRTEGTGPAVSASEVGRTPRGVGGLTPVSLLLALGLELAGGVGEALGLVGGGERRLLGVERLRLPREPRGARAWRARRRSPSAPRRPCARRPCGSARTSRRAAWPRPCAIGGVTLALGVLALALRLVGGALLTELGLRRQPAGALALVRPRCGDARRPRGAGCR